MLYFDSDGTLYQSGVLPTAYARMFKWAILNVISFDTIGCLFPRSVGYANRVFAAVDVYRTLLTVVYAIFSISFVLESFATIASSCCYRDDAVYDRVVFAGSLLFGIYVSVESDRLDS